MGLTLPQPAGMLRAKLEQALASLVPEADRDEVIVVALRALDDAGVIIEAAGWLDDDEPLQAAFREQGLDSEGMPEELSMHPSATGEVFLDMEDLSEAGDDSGLPTHWSDDDSGTLDI